MNDPHVDALIYQVDHEKSVDYTSASPLCHKTELFRISLADGTARFELNEHFATEEAAREVVDPYIRKWEFEAGICTRPDQFRLHFAHAEIVDRDPSPPTPGGKTISATATANFSVSLTVRAEATLVVLKYPPPPSECAVNPDDPNVVTMYHRYEGYRLRREPLPSMAYFCLTMLTAMLCNSPKDASQKFCIRRNVLEEVAKLSSYKGGLEARKADAVDNELTKDERRFLEEAVRKFIFRAAQVAADEDQHLPKIRLWDLPSLSK